MAIQMIETDLVDACMFLINFTAYHFGGIGKGVLEAAVAAGVGVVALKACAKGRIKVSGSVDVTVPTRNTMKHVPKWKRLEMLNFPVAMNRPHPTCWYEPEEDPVELRRLFLWALSQKGVTAIFPPGSLNLLDCIASVVQGRLSLSYPMNGDISCALLGILLYI